MKKFKNACTDREDSDYCTQHPETCSNPNCSQHN